MDKKNESADELTYPELSVIVDKIFESCEDDDDCIVNHLARLDDSVRISLLTSDLMNAWQVFYWYFREQPGKDIMETLLFSPAGNLKRGIALENGIFSFQFSVKNDRPSIVISDDEGVCATFSGQNAWKQTMNLINNGK